MAINFCDKINIFSKRSKILPKIDSVVKNKNFCQKLVFFLQKSWNFTKFDFWPKLWSFNFDHQFDFEKKYKFCLVWPKLLICLRF